MRIIAWDRNFAKKRNAMKNKTEQAYRALADLLEAGAIPTDFPTACRQLRVLPGALNEMILRELGFTGDELIMLSAKMICEWP